MQTDAWDLETDFLVAGAGAAGMSAVIAASRYRLDVLLIESMEKWGGTTSISGGGLWMPNNPLMVEDGADDSIEAAFEYMKQTIGTPGPWASDERKLAFLQAIPQYVNTLAAEGVKWTRAKDYPDYYPDLPGGRVTDTHARVLRKDGSVIEGLYAAGNNTASVMGHTYPGPGSTIAPASVFGFLGALHAAQQAEHPTNVEAAH